MSGFKFKEFEIHQDRCAMKVGTDGVLLGAWASGGKRILDIGAGTGVVSLMMAQRFPTASVLGVEMDGEACEEARENAAASPFADRVRMVCCRLQDLSLEKAERAMGGEGAFDAVVSNPPFFLNSLKNPDSKRAQARHSDSLPFRDLFVGVKRLMTEQGVFSAIVPVTVLEEFVAEACMVGLCVVRKCRVKTVEHKSPKRCLVAFAKHRCEEMEDTCEIMTDAQGNRSQWYAKITEDFYIK